MKAEWVALTAILILLMLAVEEWRYGRLKRYYQISNESLRAAINGINVIFFEFYPQEHRALLLNREKMSELETEIYNYPECLFEKNRIHPDDLSAMKEMFGKIYDGATYAEGEFRNFSQGEYRWYSYQMRTVEEREGQPVRVAVSKMDITLRKEIEIGYQNHLNALFFDNPDTLVSCRMNLTKNRVTGIYSIHKVLMQKVFIAATIDDVMKKLTEYVMPDYRGRCLEVCARDHLIEEFHKGNATIRISFSYMEKNDVKWAEAVAEMMQDPRSGEIDMIFYVADITYQRIIELILESAGSHDYEFLTFVFGKSQRFVRYNWLGSENLKMHQKFGDKLLEYIHYHEVEEKDAVLERLQWETVLEQLSLVGEYTVFYTMVQKDGTRKRKKIQFFYINDGEKLVFASQRDITDIYEAEMKQRQALAAALEEANAANAAKTDFLSRMSHDIRTPMNAIIGITALALDETDDPLAVEANLAKINSASHFLLGLINDILDMSKIEDGSVELHKESYAYGDFIGNLRTMFEPLCNNKGIALNIRESERYPAVMADKVRLNQIFFNIFSNAVKYTKQGGSISYREENVRILDDVIAIDFIISDTGIGMSREFQEHMFQPFAQENNEFTAQVQGTGLGLSITKSLVELMGGAIHIDSELGKGTTITVSLSFEVAAERDADERKEKQRKELSQANLAHRRILLVEDHPLNTEIAKRLLEKKEIIVFTADDGKNGVEKFASSDVYFFDAILMDIRMPVMDGLQATREIRGLDRPDAGSIPIIAMTANAYEEDVQLSREAGMNGHLSKPIQPDQLFQTLSEMLFAESERFAVRDTL